MIVGANPSHISYKGHHDITVEVKVNKNILLFTYN